MVDTPKMMAISDQFVAALASDATTQLSNTPGNLSFQYIVQVETIFRGIADRLVQAIATTQHSPPIVCKRGCSECCHVPSKLRPTNPLGRVQDIFGLSILDMVTLIDRFDDIQNAMGSTISDKMIAVAAHARTTMEPQACPFLTLAGECGIYQQRPVTCQIWYSADLQICFWNRRHLYLFDNDYTRQSNDMREKIEQPFKDALRRQFPALNFGWFDFLASFEMLASHFKRDRFATLRGAFASPQVGQWFTPLIIPGRAV